MELDKCKVCKEVRCDLAFLQVSETDREKEKFQKKLRDIKKDKLTAKWIKDKKFYRNMADREKALANYDRKPYMNASDWRHDDNWFICIIKLGNLDKTYYNELGYLT